MSRIDVVSAVKIEYGAAAKSLDAFLQAYDAAQAAAGIAPATTGAGGENGNGDDSVDAGATTMKSENVCIAGKGALARVNEDQLEQLRAVAASLRQWRRATADGNKAAKAAAKAAKAGNKASSKRRRSDTAKSSSDDSGSFDGSSSDSDSDDVAAHGAKRVKVDLSQPQF